MVAEIIINSTAKSLNKTYDYLVPKELEKFLKIGTRVFVPFGKQKEKEGYIVNLKENSAFATKEIIRIEDNLLTDENIKLAKLMSKRYFCNISDCIRVMLPPAGKLPRKSIKFDIGEQDKKLKLNEEQEKAFKEIKDSKYNEFLLYGITGSRKNRNLFAINTKYIRYRKNSNSISTRDITYTTND